MATRSDRVTDMNERFLNRRSRADANLHTGTNYFSAITGTNSARYMEVISMSGGEDHIDLSFDAIADSLTIFNGSGLEQAWTSLVGNVADLATTWTAGDGNATVYYDKVVA